ncbi:hypothetical protein HH214_01930 [Mucilaginibacter robiniae]|uniref:Uncharacterized protein n=1 Tax=Mucilaginibacter robiniae TaxID=2728022 RepID=A0A7L5DWU1_9SPHI|nr:hypothetical protein [Mucilaginibacter robiniae]QJD94718.1 hypothetical protein HH214_01930 [Mucilaginibacter robiniae]
MSIAKVSVITVTVFVIIYSVLFHTGISQTILSYAFLISPFLMVWMVYSVLKDPYTYPELKENEEWGYSDKAKDELGMF